MNLYYDRCTCLECGGEQYLREGTGYCPYCGGQIRHDASGRAKTKRVCRMAGAFFVAVSIPLLISAIIADSSMLTLASVAIAGLGAANYANARTEEKKEPRRRRRRA